MKWATWSKLYWFDDFYQDILKNLKIGIGYLHILLKGLDLKMILFSTHLLITGLYFQILMQIPQDIPHQTEPVDFTRVSNILFYIVLPVILALFYYWWKKKRNKKWNRILWKTRLISCWLLFSKIFCQIISTNYFHITKSNIDRVTEQRWKNKSLFSTENNHKKSGAVKLCSRERSLGNTWREDETENRNRKIVGAGFTLSG